MQVAAYMAAIFFCVHAAVFVMSFLSRNFVIFLIRNVMKEHKEREEYKTYDITDVMVLLFFIVIAWVCIARQTDVSRIRFEYEPFMCRTLRWWNELMRQKYPFNYNRKMANSTDQSDRTIRRKIKN